MHLVGARLEPLKEAARAIPDFLLPWAFALDDPLAVVLAHIAPRHRGGDAAFLRQPQQVVLAFRIRWRLPRTHGTRGQRFAVVGNDQAIVDANHAAKAAAGVAGAERGIEREQTLSRVLVVQVAVSAVQV